MSDNILDDLYNLALERKEKGDPKKSYMAKLHKKGIDTIGKKLIEEAGEVIIAAKSLDGKDKKKLRKALVAELADLEFFKTVLMAHFGITPDDVAGALAKREGISGIVEKASRKPEG
jgi:phosphoribosyl-ATP pyrophosphohydrolase